MEMGSSLEVVIVGGELGERHLAGADFVLVGVWGFE